MASRPQKKVEIQDAEIILDDSNQLLGISIPEELVSGGNYKLKLSAGKIDIIQDGKDMMSIALSDNVPKEIYESIASQEQIALINDSGHVMTMAKIDGDKQDIDNVPSILENKNLFPEEDEEKDKSNLIDFATLEKLIRENKDKEAEYISQKIMEEFRRRNKLPTSEDINNNIPNGKNLPAIVANANDDSKALQVGDSIYGQAGAIAPIGASEDLNRAGGMARAVAGFVVPAIATLAVKMTISTALTAALGPAVAAVAVPVIFAAYSGYKLAQKAKEQEAPFGKKFFAAMKENKFHAGLLLGALAAGIAARMGGFDWAADFINEKITAIGAIDTEMATDMTTDITANTTLSSTSAGVVNDSSANTGTVNNIGGVDAGEADVTATKAEAVVAAKTLPSEYSNLNSDELKTKAFELFNGRGGEEVDQAMALKLYEAAAEAGNIDAKVDLAYIQYHGLAGVEANPEVAIATMKELGKTEWLGGQKIPELNAGSASSYTNNVTSTQVEVADMVGTEELKGWEEFPAIKDGSYTDRILEERLLESVESGLANAKSGIATIVPNTNEILYTHELDDGTIRTRVIDMDDYRKTDFLDHIPVGIYDSGDKGFGYTALKNGAGNILNLLDNQGGNSNTGIIIGFANQDFGGEVIEGSMDIYAFKDSNGVVQMRLITDEYFAENQDWIKKAATQTMEMEKKGTPTIFSNYFDFHSNTKIADSTSKFGVTDNALVDEQSQDCASDKKDSLLREDGSFSWENTDDTGWSDWVDDDEPSQKQCGATAEKTASYESKFASKETTAPEVEKQANKPFTNAKGVKITPV